MKEPWLSVIMPTFNGAAYLSAALDSIVCQEQPGIEVIAIDDGSTDATPMILEEYARILPLTVVTRSHSGNWVDSTNHGLSLARGKYVCFLHQDDIWLPARLQIVRKLTDRGTDATMLIHPSFYIDESGRTVGRLGCPFPNRHTKIPSAAFVGHLLVQNFLAVCAPVFRRDVAARVSPLDSCLWYTADWDFWLKLAGHGPCTYWPEPLTAFRLHQSSQTVSRRAHSHSLLKQLQHVLDKHLVSYNGLLSPRKEIVVAARMSVAVNSYLLGRVRGNQADFLALVRHLSNAGLAEWRRYLRDSRLLDRLGARLRLGLWRGATVKDPPPSARRPPPLPTHPLSDVSLTC